MARTIGIGHQNFSTIQERNYFYVDKTDFIREWWESGDEVTLITRPRRFGKTLAISMVECFFSVNYTGRKDLFEHLSIWKNHFLLDSNVLTKKDLDFFERISVDMNDSDASMALYHLSDYLHRYYGKKVIILLDEYDTPMQEAYVNGYWNELTGITRVSKESVFSDLNNPEVVTTTSTKYETSFGFT